MSVTTLFEITQELRDMESALDDLINLTEHTDQTDERVNQLFTEFFSNIGELKESRNRKLDNYALLIREREKRAEIRKQEADRLKALADQDTALVTKLKERLKHYLEVNNEPKLETMYSKFSICGNGGEQPLQIAENITPKDLDPIFQIVRTDFDKRAIREHLKQGGTLEGIQLLSRGTHLRIK